MHGAAAACHSGPPCCQTRAALPPAPARSVEEFREKQVRGSVMRGGDRREEDWVLEMFQKNATDTCTEALRYVPPLDP